MSIKLLDCTLRDGGYVNDWNFTEDAYKDITSSMQNSGVDFIELGIMGKHNDDHFKTKFNSLEEIPIPEKINDNVKFTVMMTGNEYEKLSIPEYQKGSIDAIRFAFFKADWKQAVKQMKSLIGKGYSVFSQTMATFQYSDDEMKELIEEINKIRPLAFYIVDSFGTFYNSDIKRLYDVVNDNLDENISFGIHAHNNLQMANSNTIYFMELGKGRNIIADGSIYGMGRGAGNAGTELLMKYLNSIGKKYNDRLVWELYKKHIKPIGEEYSWGYLPEQFLVSKYHTNPAYIWYLSTKGITEFSDIEKILVGIPDEKRYTLHRDVVDSLLYNTEKK